LTKFVVDSNIAVKWLQIFRQESLVAEALELRRQWDRRDIEISVPEFFWLEIAAILWKAHRRGNCSETQAELAFESLQRLAIPTVDTRTLLSATLGIAMKYGRSVYDSIYVALAYSEKAEFLTADEKFVNAVATYLPVRWIGRSL
jgi:predicted nucleic acid-binding protein